MPCHPTHAQACVRVTWRCARGLRQVPATESAGRVHTSTATVAIMPEVDDVDVVINPKVPSTLAAPDAPGDNLKLVTHLSLGSLRIAQSALRACAVRRGGS